MVRSHVGEPACLISRSSVAERRLDKAEVDGSFPSAGTKVHLGVAQQAARVFREHEAAGSKPATGTNCQRVLGRGRSSMAELRDVTPPVPVRLRPVTPKRMRTPCVANSSGRVPAS